MREKDSFYSFCCLFGVINGVRVNQSRSHDKLYEFPAHNNAVDWGLLLTSPWVFEVGLGPV